MTKKLCNVKSTRAMDKQTCDGLMCVYVFIYIFIWLASFPYMFKKREKIMLS